MNNRSILLHTLTNNITSYDQIPMNAASGYTKYGFENGRILLSSHLHNLATKITPECIIFTIDASSNITMEQAKLHIYSMILNFQIGTTSIVKIPLSLLFNLKEPQQIGNKIYLDIPFQTFFGDIHICGLSQQDLLFNVERHTDIDELGYITNYELLCKTFLVESNDTRRYIDSSNNIVQQISSISVIVNDDEPLETSSEFIIRTNIFRGFIKGFFIETNEIDGLEEIQFFINDCIRVDFDKYMIQHKCVKISPNMIYMGFNTDISYDNREYNSYVGSLNIDRIDHSFLRLKFNNQRYKVRVYSFNLNIYNQRYGVGALNNYYQMFNYLQDFSYHSLRPVEELIQPFINQTFANNLLAEGPVFDMSLNDTNDTNYVSSYVSQTINRYIDDANRNVCPITHNQIQLNERYMLCAGCFNCYGEFAIIEWFQSLNNNNRNRTCPTCREIWRDYNVYINHQPI